MKDPIDITDLRCGPFIVEHLPGFEECIVAEPYTVDWRNCGKFRRLVVRKGSRFWPGVPKMPFVARFFLRTIGITKLFAAASAHDELYQFQGGARPGINLSDESGMPVVVGRREADVLFFHMSRADRLRPRLARVIKFALRRFGGGVWDD